MIKIIEFEGEQFSKIRYNKDCEWLEAWNIKGHWTTIQSRYEFIFNKLEKKT